MGWRNWLCYWSEVSAEIVGILQSLLTTYRLHGIDPYTYLVDVLQQRGHPTGSSSQRTNGRRWKTLFTDQPLCSDIEA